MQFSMTKIRKTIALSLDRDRISQNLGVKLSSISRTPPQSMSNNPIIKCNYWYFQESDITWLSWRLKSTARLCNSFFRLTTKNSSKHYRPCGMGIHRWLVHSLQKGANNVENASMSCRYDMDGHIPVSATYTALKEVLLHSANKN